LANPEGGSEAAALDCNGKGITTAGGGKGAAALGVPSRRKSTLSHDREGVAAAGLTDAWAAS